MEKKITWLSIHAFCHTMGHSRNLKVSVWMTHPEVLLPLACRDSHFPTGPALTEQWGCASKVAWIVKVQRLLCRWSWWPSTAASSCSVTLVHKRVGMDNFSFSFWCKGHVTCLCFDCAWSRNLSSGMRATKRAVCMTSSQAQVQSSVTPLLTYCLCASFFQVSVYLPVMWG